MVEIVPASRAHIGRIANRLRAADRLECTAMGYEPKHALRMALAQSSEAFTVKIDGEPEAMFGLVVTSALNGTGKPWMLGSDLLYRHPREMLKGGSFFLSRWLLGTPHLSGLVAACNHRAIRVLRRWGFHVSEDVDGIGFVSFDIGPC